MLVDDEVALLLCSTMPLGLVGGAVWAFSIFFSAAAFSRIFMSVLFGLLSPRVELDAIFFNVDDTAYFEWGGGSVAELALAPLGCTI